MPKRLKKIELNKNTPTVTKNKYFIYIRKNKTKFRTYPLIVLHYLATVYHNTLFTSRNVPYGDIERD